jgi:ABC-2 type transport system permease protein
MTRLVGAELLKLRTVRLPAGLLITAAALTALFASVEASHAGRPASAIGPLSTASGLDAVTTVTGWAMLLAAVLGVTISSGEFRYATATLTYLATPARGRVLAAKAVTAAVAGGCFGLTAAIVATAAGLGFAAGHHDRPALSAAALAGHGAGAVLGAALLAVLGAGLGSLVRSQLAGIVGVFVWGLVIEQFLGGFLTSLRPYLPYTAATTLAGVKLGIGPGGFRVAIKVPGHTVAGPLPFAEAAALVAGLAILTCAVAALTTLRRDIA